MRELLSRRTLALFLGLVISSAGCYTMLKHPHVPVREIDEEQHAVDWERVSFANDCASCHPADTGMYHAIAAPPPHSRPSAQWAYYYETPWWFHYYAAGNNASNATESSEEQQKRAFDRRQVRRADETVSSTLTPALPAPATGSFARRSADPDTLSAPQAVPPEDSQKREGRRDTDNRDSNESKDRSRRTRKN